MLVLPNIISGTIPTVPPPGSVSDPRTPIRLEYIKGMDWYSLLINLLSGAVLFYSLFLWIGSKTHSPIFQIGVPASAVWILLVIAWNRLWVKNDARMGKRYLDVITKRDLVYGPGFHFVAWCYSPVKNGEVDFRVRQIPFCQKEGVKGAKFPCKDGYEIESELTLMYELVESAEALSRSLMYSTEEIDEKSTAEVAQWLSSLGGLNSYLDILAEKQKAFDGLSKMFGGESSRTLFEQDLGIRVLDPQIKVFDLTPDSRAVFASRSKGEVISEVAKKLKIQFPSASDNDRLLVAQTLVGGATRTITTVEGRDLPPGLRTLAIGDKGIAVATR